MPQWSTPTNQLLNITVFAAICTCFLHWYVVFRHQSSFGWNCGCSTVSVKEAHVAKTVITVDYLVARLKINRNPVELWAPFCNVWEQDKNLQSKFDLQLLQTHLAPRSADCSLVCVWFRWKLCQWITLTGCNRISLRCGLCLNQDGSVFGWDVVCYLQWHCAGLGTLPSISRECRNVGNFETSAMVFESCYEWAVLLDQAPSGVGICFRHILWSVF